MGGVYHRKTIAIGGKMGCKYCDVKIKREKYTNLFLLVLKINISELHFVLVGSIVKPKKKILFYNRSIQILTDNEKNSFFFCFII